MRIVRDHDLAAEIVQATYTKAWNELSDGHELRYPKSWLYTVARNHALDEVRRHKRLTDEPLAYAEPDPSRLSDPQEVAEANEIVDLVWDSAAALSPEEYSLLDLHVRHGFDAGQLADALELERGAVYTRLSRMRRSLESSVTSTLLVRRGDSDCPELEAIVAEHSDGNEMTPELRRAVQTHVEECDVCCAARRRVVAPLALFGALTPIVPVGPAREGILAAILPAGGHAAEAGVGVGAAAAGTVAAARHAAKTRYLLIGAGGIAATVAVVALALSGGPEFADPAKASSVDHTVGVASSDRTVTMRWSPGKAAQGYSVMFSRNRNAEPPERENVHGTEFTSAPLGAGRWWFILRTHGKDGGWTHTLRRGPFVITVAVAKPPAAKPHTAKPPPKRAHRKARHKAQPPPHPIATPAEQLIAGVHAEPRPRRSEPAPSPAPQKKKQKAKPKPHKPNPQKPPPAAAPNPAPPVAQSPAPPVAQPPPPVNQPVTTPPVADHEDDEHDDDDEHHDERDQGEDRDHGHSDHGHGSH